jgi:hypothetical protein
MDTPLHMRPVPTRDSGDARAVFRCLEASGCRSCPHAETECRSSRRQISNSNSHSFSFARAIQNKSSCFDSTPVPEGYADGGVKRLHDYSVQRVYFDTLTQLSVPASCSYTRSKFFKRPGGVPRIEAFAYSAPSARTEAPCGSQRIR